MSIWTILDTSPTGDEREIKRAYARKLKATRPEDDPAGFQALRDAYDAALRRAQHARLDDEPGEVELEAELEAAPDNAAVHPSAAPQPGPAQVALPHPMDEARRLWAGFIAQPAVAPRQRLQKLTAHDDLLDLRVRECFELCAVEYCATDDCGDALRQELAEFFDWESDASFIGRHLPDETEEMLDRLSAQRSYAHFCSRSGSSAAIRALLADDAGRAFGSTLRAKFTRELQELLQTVRMHHPEMLHFKLNREVFATWERRVEGRRYFLEHVLHSALAGWLLWRMALMVLAYLGAAAESGLLFAGVQAVSFAAVAWFTLRRPSVPSAEGWWAGRKDTVLHDLRYRPLVQFGWIGLFAAASAAMFIPEPSLALRLVVEDSLLLCLAFATFANTAVLKPFGFLLSTVIGVSLGMMIGDQRFGDYGPVFCAAGAITGMQLFYRSGSDLFDWLGLSDRWFLPMRCLWIFGMLAAFLSAGVAQYAAAGPAAFNGIAAFAWLWLIAGMLLSRPTIKYAFGFGAAYLICAVAGSLDGAAMLRTPPLSTISIALVAVTIFMAVNMVRADSNQHQYS